MPASACLGGDCLCPWSGMPAQLQRGRAEGRGQDRARQNEEKAAKARRKNSKRNNSDHREQKQRGAPERVAGEGVTSDNLPEASSELLVLVLVVGVRVGAGPIEDWQGTER